MEKKIQIGKRLGKNREWKAVADYRKVEKESAEEKTIVESGRAASKNMEERSGKKTEKSPESILQKNS